jgi:hypothetical protein
MKRSELRQIIREEIINEMKTHDILFTDKKDYNNFKSFVKSEDATKVIKKDSGLDRKSNNYYITISVPDIEELYGDNWTDGLEGDYDSISIS